MTFHNLQGIRARFNIRMRCHGCKKLVSQIVEVPDEDGAPCDVEDLVESGFLSRLAFSCARCDGPIGTVVHVEPIE